MRALPRLLCLLLLPACRTYIPYTGTPLPERSEAQRVIRQTLEEQRNEHGPISVDVSDDRFQEVLTRETHSDDSGAFGVSVYYAKIGRMELSRSKGVYSVSIFAADGALLTRVFAYDQASAERFIDALATMRRGAAHSGSP